MTEPKYFDQIEDYLTGKLSEKETQAFEAEVSNNEALAVELELQKLEHESMDLLLEKELKHKMSTWSEAPPINPFAEKDVPKVVPIGRNRTLWRLISIAAAVGGIALSIVLYNHFKHQQADVDFVETPPSQIENPANENTDNAQPEEQVVQSPDSQPDDEPEKINTQQQGINQKTNTTEYLALAETFYGTPPTFTSSLKSDGSGDGQSTIELAAAAFDVGSYDETLQLLGQPGAEDQSNVRYLRGHAYFMEKNYQAASQEFALVASDEFLPNYQEAQWHLLLSYLAQGPKENSNFESLAQQLAEDEYSDFQEKAKKLLTEAKE